MYTIDHSTRTIDEFLRLLEEHGVEILVDVRKWPTLRRCPNFGRMSLEVSLREVDMRYAWLDGSLGGYGEEGLGKVSPNKSWESGGSGTTRITPSRRSSGRGLRKCFASLRRGG
jgi:hypothetical protein